MDKLLAVFILWFVVTFLLLPLAVSHDSYKKSVMISIGIETGLAIILGLIYACRWAFDTLGI